MKITLYCDSTLALDLQFISENVSRLAPDLLVTKGRATFEIERPYVSAISSIRRLSEEISQETHNSDLVILFTELPYDNNYFWEGIGRKCIVSMWGWDSLTNIPRNNGAVFFLCSIIIHEHDIGIPHNEQTGCINDFMMNKTDVDPAMRAGLLCNTCITHFRSTGSQQHSNILDQVQVLLREISTTSRTEMDICDYWRMRGAGEQFDVFLCHNSQDKEAVRFMNKKLQKSGIRTWFDEEQLPPGRMWQELLEEQISQIKTAIIFVGQSGLGPWQDVEHRAFINEFVRRRCPVIPVILPQCNNVPQLPLFLRQFTWVDFRKVNPDPFGQLLWSITGKRK